MENKIENLTAGNVTRQMLRFAWPLFLANLLQSFYSIVDMVAQLQQVDLSGLEVNLSEQCNVFREDVPTPSMSREAVLQNAPAREAGCVLVPRVMEE